MKKNIFSKKTAGFSLIELLVAMALFGIVMIIISTLFVEALNLQRRAFNIQQAEENVSFLLESMTKEIRVSSLANLTEDNDCSLSPSATLGIVHPVNGAIGYSLVGTDLMRTTATGVPMQMNSNTVLIKSLGFCIAGAEALDGLQPRVTILMTIQSKKTSQMAEISSQVTVSLRPLFD